MKNKFGVPCKNLKEQFKDVLACTTEEEAMAMACGASFVDGVQPEVFMQNTGFLKCLNVICTLFYSFDIKLPRIVVSDRRMPLHHSYSHLLFREVLKHTPNVEVIEE